MERTDRGWRRRGDPEDLYEMLDLDGKPPDASTESGVSRP
jgi:hypothetical protein